MNQNNWIPGPVKRESTTIVLIRT